MTSSKQAACEGKPIMDKRHAYEPKRENGKIVQGVVICAACDKVVQQGLTDSE